LRSIRPSTSFCAFLTLLNDRLGESIVFPLLPFLLASFTQDARTLGLLAGSYAVAWFGMRINTFANSRSAFASLGGKPYPTYAIPTKAGMSIGMLLISIELLVMLCILLFIDVESAGACFIGFAIGESLGASVLRIAGIVRSDLATDLDRCRTAMVGWGNPADGETLQSLDRFRNQLDAVSTLEFLARS
jgi:Na+/H+-translocating membrane pyrophosphatase